MGSRVDMVVEWVEAWIIFVILFLAVAVVCWQGWEHINAPDPRFDGETAMACPTPKIYAFRLVECSIPERDVNLKIFCVRNDGGIAEWRVPVTIYGFEKKVWRSGVMGCEDIGYVTTITHPRITFEVDYGERFRVNTEVAKFLCDEEDISLGECRVGFRLGECRIELVGIDINVLEHIAYNWSNCSTGWKLINNITFREERINTRFAYDIGTETKEYGGLMTLDDAIEDYRRDEIIRYNHWALKSEQWEKIERRGEVGG